MKERKRTNQAGGNRGESRSHAARLRYIAMVGRLRMGATRAQVCAEFGVSESTIDKARRAMGVSSGQGCKGRPKPWLRHKRPAESVLARLRLVASGMGYAQAARATGVTRQAVAYDARRWGDVIDEFRGELGEELGGAGVPLLGRE